MDTINLAISYTKEDFLRALNTIKYNNKVSKFIFAFAKIFFIAFALLCFSIAVLVFTEKTVRVSQSFAPFLFSGIISLLLSFGTRPFEDFCQKINLEKQIKSSPLLRECNFISIDDNGLKVKTFISSSEICWEAFVKSRETEQDFFLFTSNKVAVFIPKYAFTNEGQITQLRELVKRKLGDKANF